jgi:hypothetical protein
MLFLCVASAGALAEQASAESFPVGYTVDVDESGVSTGELGGSGSLTATGSFGRARECEQSSDGGPFSIGHYPPLNCAEAGRNYATTGSPETPSEFLYTGNEHCVAAGRPVSGSNFFWHVRLPHTGYWHIATYIPSWTQYGAGDLYVLSSDEGQSQSGSVWQQGFHGQWVGLFGSHRFTAGQEYTVQLPLTDSEDPFCHYQTADQMEWVYDGPSSPSAAILEPADRATYPEGALVKTRFACSEALNEALTSCSDSNGSSGGAGALDTSELGSHTYTVTAKGVNGATGSARIGYTVLAHKIVCSQGSGKLTLSPGLTQTPTVQTARLKGTLTGCSGGGFTEGRFSAVLTSTGPTGCAILSSAGGQPASGTLEVTWRPKAKGGKSLGSLQVSLGQASEFPLDGMIEGGMFAPASIFGTIAETYTNAPQCGVRVNERVKPVKTATLTTSPVELY